MDKEFYSKTVVTNFLRKELFFGDKKLEKYFEDGDVAKFRKRATVGTLQSFEKIVYVTMTNTLRDIIFEILGEITEHMKPMGDVVLSGGEAFNLYMDYSNRLITTDIDAKFVPRLRVDSKFFGKLQAIKLILWDKLGEISKRFSSRFKSRIESKKYDKIFKFLGISIQNTKPTITRRYTLIKKKKLGSTNQPSKGDVFIDVELFALDLTIRYFSIKSGKIETQTLGGILDIPFMRPAEFGHEVALDKRRGITYLDQDKNRFTTNNKIYVASKEFLIEDIYLMTKLGLRPEKKDKDRRRLEKLGKLFTKTITAGDGIETIFRKVKPFLKRSFIKSPTKYDGKVSFAQASRVNPTKYEKYTTKPNEKKLGKQIVNGLNPVTRSTSVNGYNNSHGNQRLNLETLKWTTVNNTAYVKNEFRLRPINGKALPKNLKQINTLYGYNPVRNANVPKNILNRASAIPFVGLKN